MLEEDKKTVEHQFDSYCKKILKWEFKSYRIECAKRYERELLVEDFPTSKYIENYEIEDLIISLEEERFIFSNELLYRAIDILQEDKKRIVLYFYFKEMTDEEIAKKLELIRRTVNYKRNRALRELKKFLEGYYEK